MIFTVMLYIGHKLLGVLKKSTQTCYTIYMLDHISDDVIIAGNFSYTEKITVKYAGAAAMYFVSKKLKKKYNITDERAALYDAAETWVDALNGRDFLGMYNIKKLTFCLGNACCSYLKELCLLSTKNCMISFCDLHCAFNKILLIRHILPC